MDTAEEEWGNGADSGSGGALRMGFNAWHGLLAGLKMARMLNVGIRRATSDLTGSGQYLAQRSVDATASVVSRQFESLGPFVFQQETTEALVGTIQAGAGAFSQMVTSISSGIDGASAVGHGFASFGIEASIGGVAVCEEAVRLCLSAANIRVTNVRRHSVLEALHCLCDASAKFSWLSPLQIVRSISALSSLQDASNVPFPPRNVPMMDSFGHSELKEVLRTRYLQCLSTYSTFAMELLGRPTQSSMSGEDVLETIAMIPSSDILSSQWSSKINQPAHILFLDHATMSIVLCIRGSVQLADVITDLCFSVDEQTESSHRGMKVAAEHLDSVHRLTVEATCASYPDYSVVVQGHSLGGGTATLLTLMWLGNEKIAGPHRDSPRIQCFSFGAPCVVTREVALLHRNSIISLVKGHDCISRLSECTARRLHVVLAHLCRDSPAATASPGEHTSGNSGGDVVHDGIASSAAHDWNREPTQAELETICEGLTGEKVMHMVKAKLDLDNDTATETLEYWNRQLRNAIMALRLLYERDSTTRDDKLLFPAGRTIMFVSLEELRRAGTELPSDHSAVWRYHKASIPATATPQGECLRTSTDVEAGGRYGTNLEQHEAANNVTQADHHAHNSHTPERSLWEVILAANDLGDDDDCSDVSSTASDCTAFRAESDRTQTVHHENGNGDPHPDGDSHDGDPHHENGNGDPHHENGNGDPHHENGNGDPQRSLLWEGVALDLGGSVLDSCSELVLSMQSLSDHLPHSAATVFGIESGFEGDDGVGELGRRVRRWVGL